ncbi:glycerophosphoryl diester phosphodiesterase [Klebsormidium nitens]|uniref:glycerophosphodiester phosphodiesterase n=1 Tax=Klebsormidium nitens TaxID=105231 RepID=A0A1Y1HXA9_KLENI|nr:glycerophosphoryl diester phosphodiesterase [Klebsormidium nitens]|eukprot:GAQ81601.1 glycerophosphoryl diester phosphodiesterase [Klebsormidium nitens]
MGALRVSVVACLLLASTLTSALNIPTSPKYPPVVPRQSPFVKPIVGAGLQSERPYNVAHRGACNIYPEETEPSYLAAIDLGADFIEGDVEATKDGVLVMCHDIELSLLTDVANRTEFASKRKTYNNIVGGDGVNTGWFIVDFTFEELSTLRVKQRFPTTRDKSFDGQFPIITFEKYIQIALAAPRIVGIYPEIKSPVFINQYVQFPGGKSFEQAVVEMLQKYGYQGKYKSADWYAKPVFIQAFAPTSLQRAAQYTDLPLVFLYDSFTARTQDTNQTFASLATDESMAMFASMGVVGLGPAKGSLMPVNTTTNYYVGAPIDFVTRAHKYNMEVHPYTFRADSNFLAYDLHGDFLNELLYFDKVIGVDGYFTDHTENAYKYLEWTHPIYTRQDIVSNLRFP